MKSVAIKLFNFYLQSSTLASIKLQQLGNKIKFTVLGIIVLFLVFIFLLSCQMFNKSTKSDYVEGPHIFYDDDLVKETSILQQGEHFHLIEKEISIADLASREFKVTTQGSPAYFSFRPIQNIVIPPDRHAEREKVIVISDIEGDFDYFKNILLANGVIDDQFAWVFDNGSLVLLGDIFDRDDQVTECLWLVYKLEREAALANGKVHLILGNHEIMVLSGDHRYVNRKYKNMMAALGKDYQDFFAENTELGRWLRSKNTIEIIGNTLFSHGGISPVLISKGLTINEINEIVRRRADSGFEHDHHSNNVEHLIMGSSGPLWYRGYFDGKADEEEVDQVLSHFGVEHIVVGHTLVNDVTALYGKKIFAIDVGRKHVHEQVALLVEAGKFYKVDTRGTKTLL